MSKRYVFESILITMQLHEQPKFLQLVHIADSVLHKTRLNHISPHMVLAALPAMHKHRYA